MKVDDKSRKLADNIMLHNILEVEFLKNRSLCVIIYLRLRHWAFIKLLFI